MIRARLEDAICWLVIVTLIARAEPRAVGTKPHALDKHWRPYFSAAAEDESAPALRQTQLYDYNQPVMLREQMEARVAETSVRPKADAISRHSSRITQGGYPLENDLRIRRLMEELVLKSRLEDRTDKLEDLLPKDYSANTMTRHSNGKTETGGVYKREKLKVDGKALDRFLNEALQKEKRTKSASENQVSLPEAQINWAQRENSSNALDTQLTNVYHNTNNGTHDKQNNRLANQLEVSEVNENQTATLPLGANSEGIATNWQRQRTTETQNNINLKPTKHILIKNTVNSAEHQNSLETSNNHIPQADNFNAIKNMSAIADFSSKSSYHPTVDKETNNNALNFVSLSNKNSNNFSASNASTQHSLLLHKNIFALTSGAFIPEPNDWLSSVQTMADNTSLLLTSTPPQNTNSSAFRNGAAGRPETNENIPNKTMAVYEYFDQKETSAAEEEPDQSAEVADTAEFSTNTGSAHWPAMTTNNNVAATSSTLDQTTTNEPMLYGNQSAENSQLEWATPPIAGATSTAYQRGDESVEYVEAAIANFLRSEIASNVDIEAEEKGSFAANSNVPATAAKQQEFHRTDVIKSATTKENDPAAPLTLGEEVRSTVNCFTLTSAMDSKNHAGIIAAPGAWSITSGAAAEQRKAADKNTGDATDQFDWAPVAGKVQWPARAAAHESEGDDNDRSNGNNAYKDRTKATEMSTIEKQSAAILEKDNSTTYDTRAHMADAPHMERHVALQRDAEDAVNVAGHRNELPGYLTVGESAESGNSGEEDVDADDDSDDDEGDNDSDEAIHIMSHLHEMVKTIEGDKLSLRPVDDVMKSEAESTQSPYEDGKVPSWPAAASPHRETIKSTASGAEITTTNWWRTLSYAEIRKFLNTIFDSAAQELYAEIARKSKEIQSGKKEVDALLSADAGASINDFWSFW